MFVAAILFCVMTDADEPMRCWVVRDDPANAKTTLASCEDRGRYLFEQVTQTIHVTVARLRCEKITGLPL